MKKKRFIAGAICPRCAAMDRIFVFSQEDTRIRECFDCGYQDNLNNDKPAELSTRVNINSMDSIKSTSCHKKNTSGKKTDNNSATPIRILFSENP